MNLKQHMDSRMKNLIDNPSDFMPGLSLDCIILGFHEGQLKILLNKFEGYEKWMLPGGYILRSEDIDTAAYNALKSRTGLDKVYLRQFHIFGDANRTDHDENEVLINYLSPNADRKLISRFTRRYVCIGYFALVDYTMVEVQNTEFETAEWFDSKEIPQLYGDHNKIIDKALEEIRINIGKIPIGYELLPKKFTMSQLRSIYEAIMGEELDRRNFQRKLLSTGLIIKLDEMSKKQGVKPANLFSFDSSKLYKGYQLFE